MNSLNTSNKEIRIKTVYGHISVKVWNESGKKTPILAIHGWMDNAGTWDNLCPLLDKDHPIYALDLLGFGYSSPPPNGVGKSPMDHLITMDKVIQHFNWKRVILLGHSMGGEASIFYAGSMPNLVEKLIVIDNFQPPSVKSNDLPTFTASSLEQLRKAEDKLKTDPPRYSYDEIVQKLVRSYNGSLTEDAAKTLLIRNSRKYEDGTYSFTHSPIAKVNSTFRLTFVQLKAFCSKIKCDLLHIKADSSRIYGPKEHSKEILNTYKEASKNFVFEVLEGKHHLHLVNPEPVAEVINRFLHDIPQSEESKMRSEDFIKSKL